MINDRSSAEPTQTELERWQSLPSTPSLREQLRLAIGALSEAEGSGRVTLSLPHMRRRVEVLEQDVRDGARRDAISASRPGYCWCLGLGGSGRQAIRPAPGAEYVYSFERFCACPLGQEAEAAAISARQEFTGLLKVARTEQAYAAAGIPSEYDGLSLSSWEEASTAAGYGLAERKAQALRDWALGSQEWLYLWGDMGAGKTGLAAAVIGLLVGQSAFSPAFFTEAGLLGSIKAAYDQPGDSERAAIARLVDPDLLVIDDLGTAPATPWAVSALYEVVNGRYSRKGARTIITSNLGPSAELRAHLVSHGADPRLADRIQDRIVDRSVICRLQDAPNLRHAKTA